MSFLARLILRAETTAEQNRHTHHSKVIRRNRTYFRGWFLSKRRRWRAGDMEAAVPLAVVERAVGTNRHRFDARNGLHASKQLRPECVLLFVFFVFCFWQRNVEIHHAVRIKTERRVLRVPKTLQH